MNTLYNYLRMYNINLSNDSGKEISRAKGSLFTHTGIIMGFNRYTGETMVFHNHKDEPGPSIVTLTEFEKGNRATFTNKASDDRDTVLIRSFKQVELGKSYGLLDYNCQDATKVSREGRTGSHAVANTAGSLILGAILIAAFGGRSNKD